MQHCRYCGGLGMLERKYRGDGRTGRTLVIKSGEVEYHRLMDEFTTSALTNQNIPPYDNASCLLKWPVDEFRWADNTAY